MTQDYARKQDEELRAKWEEPERVFVYQDTLRDRLSEHLFSSLWLAVLVSHFVLAPAIYLVICSIAGPIKPPYTVTVLPCIYFCWGVILWTMCVKKN